MDPKIPTWFPCRCIREHTGWTLNIRLYRSLPFVPQVVDGCELIIPLILVTPMFTLSKCNLAWLLKGLNPHARLTFESVRAPQTSQVGVPSDPCGLHESTVSLSPAPHLACDIWTSNLRDRSLVLGGNHYLVRPHPKTHGRCQVCDNVPCSWRTWRI